MNDTEPDPLDMEKLAYQWLQGYDESQEPDSDPEWSGRQGTYEADADEEAGRWDGDTLTVFTKRRPDEYVKSDAFVSLEENR